MGKGPLADPRLRAIEERLNGARFDDAQRLLSELDERESLRPGAAYLTTRLLYQRGRLDNHDVVERLREVINQAQDFPEASSMLEAAERGALEPDASGFLTATLPPVNKATSARPGHNESWEAPPDAAIPRAPPLPQVSSRPAPPPTRPPSSPVSAPPASPPVSPRTSSRTTSSRATSSRNPVSPLSAPPVSRAVSSPPVSPRVRGHASRESVRDTMQEFVSRSESLPPNTRSPHSSQPPSSDSAWRSVAELGDAVPPSSNPRRATPVARIELGPRRSSAPSSPRTAPVTRAPLPDLRRTGSVRSTLAQPDGGRSVRPLPPDEDPLPTALTVASLLDDGEPGRALGVLDRWDGPLSPELVILRARALWDLDRKAAALADLDRVSHAPLVEPELRASSARLLIEMDEVERAVQQARHAYQDEPGSIMVRMTLAWALVRAGRRSGHTALYQQADSLLSTLRPRATPLPALVHGLRACIAAELNDNERALGSAQLALGLDPYAADALAALALASAKLDRDGDARRAWLRLREVNPVEADSLATTLSLRGIDLDASEPAMIGDLVQSVRLWEPLEVDLVAGRRERAIATFERACADHARDPQRRVQSHDFTGLAVDAARFFTEEPVFRHFAPYDLSLASTSRLEAAMSVLYGPGPRLNPVTGRHPVLLLIGAYLGECVRQAFDGRWRGTLQAPQQAAVEVRDHVYTPFERVAQRLHVGRSIRLDTEVLAHPAAEPHARRVELGHAPPTPWDPDEYPPRELFPKLGRALAQSVVALYTSEYGGGPLDCSLASVSALDSYVTLLSPPTVAPEGASGWVRRAALLVGAYLVDVLCENLGGTFVDNEVATGPLVYEVLLTDGSVTHPVLHTYERLCGTRMTPLVDYVTKLSRRGRS